MSENYILCILLGVSVILNLVLFVAYKIWRNRAKKSVQSVQGTLYLMDDEMYSEFKVNLEDLYAMDTVTLKVVSAAKNRKE